MDEKHKWYILAAVVAMCMLLLLPRFVTLRSYSDEDMHAACSRIYGQYQDLVANEASEQQWEGFEREAIPELKAMVEDFETHPGARSPGTAWYYSIAKNDLPMLIANRNEKGKIDPRVEHHLSLAFAASSDPKQALTRPATAGELAGVQADKTQAWDPVVVGVLFFDFLLVVGVAGRWSWRNWEQPKFSGRE